MNLLSSILSTRSQILTPQEETKKPSSAPETRPSPEELQPSGESLPWLPNELAEILCGPDGDQVAVSLLLRGEDLKKQITQEIEKEGLPPKEYKQAMDIIQALEKARIIMLKYKKSISKAASPPAA